MKNPIFLIITSMFIFSFCCSCEELELEEPGQLVPLTVDEDPSLPSISVNNTLLHAETFGIPGDPIIIVLHGGPGADYRSILNCKEFVNDGYFVVFYDQRGSGLSMRHDAELYNSDIMIDDLRFVIDYYRNPTQKIILVGHSWGAILATAYTNKFPTEVDGLILMEPGGFTWEDTEEYILRSRPLELFGESTNDYVYQDQFLTGSDHNILDYKAGLAAAVEYAEGNRIGLSGPFPYWRYGSECSRGLMEYVIDNPFDYTSNLNQYKTKVLFAYSELNEAYGQEHAELVSAPFPNIQLVQVDDTGHEIPYFGWDNFYPNAQEYLKSIK